MASSTRLHRRSSRRDWRFGTRRAASREPRGAELAAALARELRGEVRADAYTRHLFASDASMYAIEPLGVAFPRDADDVAAAVAIAARASACRSSRAARGTSLAGQTRRARARARHLAPHGRDRRDRRRGAARARRARRRAGGPQPRRRSAHGLGFGPDTSTSNRATLGGMIGNNSSGSHSIVYGTTIDHVHELEVVLADGIARHASAGRRASGARAAARSRARSTAGCRRSLRDHARAIAERLPAALAPGRRLPARPARRASFDLAQARRRLRGHARRDHRGDGRAGPSCRRRSMFAVGHFDSVAERDRRDRGRARAATPAAVEMIDRTILELSRSQARVPRARRDRSRATPSALLFVTFFGDTQAEVARRARRARGARGASTATATTRCAPSHAGRAGRADQGPQGRPRAADGRQRGRRAGRSRSSRTPRSRPSGSASTSRASRRSSTATASTAGFYGHCSVGCLHIRPFVDLTEPGRDRDDARGRRGGRRAGRRVRRRQLARARRRAASAAPFNRAHLRRRALRGDARGQGACSTRDGRAQPGHDGRRRRR